MWKRAITLSTRNKELEYEANPYHQKTLSIYADIQKEIISPIEQTRMELLIFSNGRILDMVLSDNKILKTLSHLVKK
jgi:hypothetical protein